MTIQEIETRLAQIKEELDKPEANLDALQEEVRSLNEQKAQLAAQAKADAEKRRMIAEGLGKVTETHNENEQRTDEEIRNSPEYVHAYAEFIRTGDSRECRSLLTANVDGGTIPVPVFLQEMIETAWEKNDILNRVSRTYLRGNIKVPFELSADGAYVHTEGSTAPTEESLTFGLVTLTPETIKKWVNRAAA